MKKAFSVFVAFIILIVSSGCGFEKVNNQGYTLTDDLGRSVTVESTERVVALLGSFADMWLLSGGEICAAADDAWEDFNLQLSDDVVNLGSTHRPNKEELISVNPTFVIASAKLSKHLELQETLDSMGVPAAYFDVGDFDDYLRVLKIMTEITDDAEGYRKYGVQQQQKIESIIERRKAEAPQTVLVMRASAASIRAKNSEDTMLGGMLKDFGCVNIADSNSMILDNLSVESILLNNPQKIFFIETGDDEGSVKKAVEAMFSENPLWYELDAVKNGKVYYMEKALYNLKPNASFTQAYEKLEKILYEE